MLRLEDIKKDAAVNGIESGQIVRIITTELVGENALTGVNLDLAALLLRAEVP